MRCPNCAFDGPSDHKYCGMCGTQLVHVCPSCGFANPVAFRFCGQCGVRLTERVGAVPSVAGDAIPLPAAVPSETSQPAALPTAKEDAAVPGHLEGERRLVTVILADVSESTDLLGQIGTERWVEVMNRILQILEAEVYRYGGQVDQFRGDGLVALFGATSAHEDDAEHAVLAALAMQEAVLPYAEQLAEQEGIDLLLRVGVNTGEAVVASIGDSAQHSEDTAMGSAIALASRMETTAEPGTVLVSENTYQLVQAEFEWEPLGDVQVKGVSDPIGVYRPLSPRPDAHRSRRMRERGLPTLLVGRDEDFQVLTGCLADLGRGRGGTVMVVAEEGMGKSHLVARVRAEFAGTDGGGADAPATTVQWLQARCRSHEQSWPYAVWLDLFRRWLGSAQLGDELQIRDRLRAEAESLWGERTGEYYPYLAFWLSLPLDEALADHVSALHAEGLRQQLYVVIKAWVQALMRRGPVVVAFEDMHWIDASSLRLLQYCLPLCETEAVQWWLMFRPDRASAMWDFRHFVETQYPHRLTSVTLEPLTEVQSEHMLDLLVGDQVLPGDLRALIVQRAEGNPYYIEEFISALAREGVLVRDAWTGRWRATRAVTSIDLPDTLRGLLQARIDGLSSEERRVLQIAAVIGTVFWEEVLAELAEDRALLPSHMAALQRAGLIRERGKVPDLGREYHFGSSLIRDVAYDSILQAQRTVYHRQVADHLADLFGKEILAQYYGVVAYHYRNAQEPGKELFYALSAAEHAQGIYANTEALTHYRRSLELLGSLDSELSDRTTQDWRLEALQGLGQVSFGLGEIVQAETHFREAIALGHQTGLAPQRLVLLHYWLCEVLFWQNRYAEQIEVAEAGLAQLGNDTRSPEAALMNQEIAIGHFERGNLARFREYTYRTAQFLSDLPYTQELRPAYNHVSKAYRSEKRVGQAMRWLQELQERAEAHHDLRALGEAHYLAGDMLADQGDLRGALARSVKAADLHASIEDTKHESWCLGNAGLASLMLGEVAAAESYVRRGLELALEVGNRRDIAWAYWRLGQVEICRGQFAEAIEAFQRAVGLFREVGRHRSEMRATYAVGRTYLEMGERGRALEQLVQAAVAAEPQPVRQDTFSLAAALSSLEQAYDSAERFRSFCRQFEEQHPEIASGALAQWYLEPADAPAAGDLSSDLVLREDFSGPLGQGWVWEDPYGDSEFTVGTGFEVRAAAGRDLWLVNLGAPRLVREVDGRWVAQTVCGPAVQRTDPATDAVIGGIVLWQDRENYLRLDRGAGGERELSLLGCIEKRDVVIGRGWLPEWLGMEGRVYLRLQHTVGHVEALCSVDGEMWFAVGRTSFPAATGARVGVYAVGLRDPLLYPGRCASSEGIRFESFWLWRMAE